MSDLIVLGTDTDVGKTTFCLLWLAAFADRYEYWKPVETGTSDCQRLAQLVPDAVVHPVVKRFPQPLAPPLAARLEKDSIPSASEIAAARPTPRTALLVETFGGPFSPLNDSELQISLIEALAAPTILISSSALGVIGRTLTCLRALAALGVLPARWDLPAAVVLVGKVDDFAAATIRQYAATPVFSLLPPASWDVPGIQRASQEQQEPLDEIRALLPDCGDKPRRSLTTHHSPLTTHHSPLTTHYSPPDLLERDRRTVWHPYTSLCDPDPPLACVGAQDEFLFLADGRKVIDGISSWWTILHGHRHPALLAALHEAAAAFDHVHFAGVTHAPAVELAELLLTTAPWKGGRVFYSDNGSTAVEVALKMAYQYWCHQGQPQRTRFIGFEGGYHGDTFGAMAVSRDPVFFGRFEPLLFGADIVPLSAERLDDTLNRHRDEVAAVIVEPLVQGAGGMRMHTPDVLRRLAEVAHSHGVLFIADEVMTCGGRTGFLWAHQAAGIAPDLLCAAKTLAGGILPLAATLVAPHVVSAWETSDRRRTFFHGHSFTAHPLACAVAAVNWKLLTAGPNPVPGEMERFWRAALASLARSSKIRDVRICGTIAAVEVAVAGGYLADAGRKMRRIGLDNGVLLRPLGSVLYAMPPLCTSLASLDQIARVMIQAVTSG